METANASITKFNRELKDVNIINLEIDVTSFEAFADYFIDGFLVDWFIQSKITKNRDMVQKLSIETENIVTQLYKELDFTNKRLTELKDILVE
jgi:hypothetical protein